MEAQAEAHVEADVEFRRALHFRSDEDFVRSLYADWDPTTSDRAAGAIFTDEELRELQARQALESDAAALRALFSEPDVANRFGGVLIDHAAGGR